MITGTGIPKATTTIKIVIPLVHSFFLAKIQIIYSFANSLARAGWLVRSVRGGGGGGRVDITFYENSTVLTDGDNYKFLDPIDPSMKLKSEEKGLFFLHSDDPK